MLRNTSIIFVVIFTALLLSGCNKKPETAAEKVAAVQDELRAPTDGKDESWRVYLGTMLAPYKSQITGQVTPYYLPRASMEPDQVNDLNASKFSRQMETVHEAVQRTVLPGNMMAFGSPDSKSMADLIVEAFADPPKDALKGSKVLFIGNADDSDRVKAAVEPTGAEYIFVEAK
jgi:hypothetical protein